VEGEASVPEPENCPVLLTMPPEGCA
jgi:hypothetical protein